MEQRTCAVCNEPLTGRRTRYCSDDCQRVGIARWHEAHKERKRSDPEYRDRINSRTRELRTGKRVEVECWGCGKTLRRLPLRMLTEAPCCSGKCKGIVRDGMPLPDDHPARWVLGQWSLPVRYYDCEDCGQLCCTDARQPSPKRCQTCRHKHGDTLHPVRFISAQCSQCGEWFVTDRRQFASLPPQGGYHCSTRCFRRAARHRRSARKRGAYVGNVVRAKVLERDRYTCQLCGKRLAMKQQVPHPKAPTIDHIIPLADGGTHEMANVQAAHFMCNALKSDHATGNQLLLIG